MVDTPSGGGTPSLLQRGAGESLSLMNVNASEYSALVHNESKNLGLVSIDSHLMKGFDVAAVKRARWSVLDWFLGTLQGQFAGLVLFMLALNLLGTVMWMATGGNDLYDTSWYQSMWFAWGMFFDPGTQMGFDANERLSVKVVGVLFSVFGFLYNLLFLGLIVDLVKNTLDYWRRKRSRIVANGHTILLGWSEKTLFVMEELVKSAENRGVASKIVLLAERDLFDMKQEICRHFPHANDQKMIQCRTGSPDDCEDLQRISAKSAKEIIILSGAGKPRHADLVTVRTVVALAALPEQPKGCIVAEVRVAETSPAIGAVLDRAEGVFARDAVNRVMCLMGVQPVIGDVYQQLMSWCQGAEIYLKSPTDLGLTCATFGEAHRDVTGGIVLGVSPVGKHAILTPDSSYEIGESDKLLVLADSDVDIMARATRRKSFSRKMSRAGEVAALRAASSGLSESSARHQSWSDSVRNKKVIIVGWPDDIDDILVAMDDYVSPGTEVHILANQLEQERERRLHANPAVRHLKNITVKHKVGSVTSLNSLAELPLADASAILVLADSSLTADPKTSDSACLATTITVDGLLKGRYPKVYTPPKSFGAPRIICEVLSPVIERALPNSHKLRASATFFHSSAVETGLFTMAASQASVYNALLMLMQPNSFGDTTLVPAENYIKPHDGEGATFEQLSQRVRQDGDILLGFCGAADDKAPSLNPKDAGAHVSKGDRLIVLTKALGSKSPPATPKKSLAESPSTKGKPGLTAISVATPAKAAGPAPSELLLGPNSL